MKLLDLFSGAGGSAMGFYRAGFTEIVGVDNRPQKHYPFNFVLADALDYASVHGHKFDLIAAAPPCKGYTRLKAIAGKEHPLLIEPTREVLQHIGRPYVIENVYDARRELINPIMLCGTMFGLRVLRHRVFECDPVVRFPPGPCQHVGRSTSCKIRDPKTGKRIMGTLKEYEYLTVTGKSFLMADARIAMGIDWMTQREISQAIPPAYTHWLGTKLIELIR